ncbi:hypothetical protein AGMMS49991_10990 [Spirochaetia bacterium]|nr:hypothetical protein AGMMS49991_10990 [Spirochaetia bacterium]
MKFSLIMATLGRGKEIDDCIQSLLNQTYKNYELLIIDQNQDNRVYDIYRQYQDKLDIKYFQSDKKGISVSRNIGLEHAAGDIIAFPDDDCEYPPDALEKVAVYFNAHSECGFYTCNIKEKNGNRAILKAPAHDMKVTVANFMKTSISITMFIRVQAMGRFRFDKHLGAGTQFGSGEESDLMLFLLCKKNLGYYHANDYIYHPYKESNDIERCFQYGKGYGAVHKKALSAYKLPSRFFSFLAALLRGMIKICLYPFFPDQQARIATLKGRIFGFIHYSTRSHIVKKILINGDFLCRRLTGIERYAYELTLRLDTLIQSGEAAIIVPANTPNVPPYRNLEIIHHKTNIRSHILWQMVTLQFFLLTHKQYTVLEFGNTCLPFAPGIVFLHDIYCDFFPEDFTGNRDKIIRLYNKWQYRLIAKKAKRIVTVSYFSRNQIAQTHHIDPEKITVIYSSWNHFKIVNADYSVFDASPALSKPFYFSLGSLSKRKNIQWIVEYASRHPDSLFLLSGTALPTAPADELDNGKAAQNIILLGYLDDAKVKALMEKCKAFILPSYYEGFGLTPLEALSCGAQIIVANAASLPEIYGNTAHYIDPFNTDVDLDELLQQPLDPPDVILQKYSYNTSAQQLYDLIQQC